MFLLYVAKAKAIVIPKKYFSSSDDLKTFKSEQVKNVSLFNKVLAGVAHAFALMPIPAFNFSVTFVYWYLLRYKSRFIDYHGRQSLNFQF
jgi:uncharacterized Tic20 family protein